MNPGTRLDPVAIGTLAALNMRGQPDLVATVATAFLKAVPGYLVTLRENVGSPNVKILSRVSHDLKSSSASLGAVALASLCGGLEKVVRSGTTSGTADRLCRIVDEIEAVRPELEALLLSRRNDGDAVAPPATARTYKETK
jgi:HPt (histidine-containing phosphotransfer) domain-containing protein